MCFLTAKQYLFSVFVSVQREVNEDTQTSIKSTGSPKEEEKSSAPKDTESTPVKKDPDDKEAGELVRKYSNFVTCFEQVLRL